MTGVQFRRAEPSDLDVLVTLMDRFNRSQGYPFDAGVGRRALEVFTASPALGRLWLILTDGEQPAGYLVLSFGFSFEYGGHDAFIDELFVDERARGAGVGRAALEFALDQARALNVGAIHLEVEPDNPRAERLYERSGFRASGRRLLTHRLGGGGAR